MGLRDELARMRTALGAHLQAVTPVTVVIEWEGDTFGEAGGAVPPAACCSRSRTPAAGRSVVQLLWQTLPGPGARRGGRPP